MAKLVRIRRRPGSFGELWAGRLAVRVEGAQPVRGRIPVLLVDEIPIWLQPQFLEEEPASEPARSQR
jgi:hypothetical protein